MKANVGIYDRYIRLLVGAIVTLFAIFGMENSSPFLTTVGVIVLISGLIGWCPLYQLMQINTRRNMS